MPYASLTRVLSPIVTIYYGPDTWVTDLLHDAVVTLSVSDAKTARGDLFT